jgi:hypothetical protein
VLIFCQRSVDPEHPVDSILSITMSRRVRILVAVCGALLIVASLVTLNLSRADNPRTTFAVTAAPKALSLPEAP